MKKKKRKTKQNANIMELPPFSKCFHFLCFGFLEKRFFSQSIPIECITLGDVAYLIGRGAFGLKSLGNASLVLSWLRNKRRIHALRCTSSLTLGKEPFDSIPPPDMKNSIEVARINKKLGILSTIKNEFIHRTYLVSGREKHISVLRKSRNIMS